jgi:hypothetical protein
MDIHPLRKANFNRLFNWRFDKKRVKEVRKNWKNKRFKDLLEKHILSYELECDDYDIELLKNHIPLIGETISNYSIKLYKILEVIVTLIGGGMSGVSFRHSLDEVRNLLKQEGFEYKFVKEVVLDFESRLYKEYSDEISK